MQPPVVVCQQSTKPLTTAYWSVGSRVWAISQKQHHIALALMRTLLVIMRHVCTEHIPQGLLAKAVLDEAERCSDPARATTARAEIDFLTAQLATAYGIGRPPRKGADTNEKVRKAVTKCLRTSLARIQKAHLPLWRHLHTALRTGTFCSYAPEPPITWEV
jgi:hypothetical protein